MTSKRFNKIIVWLLSVFLLVSLALPTTSYAGSSLMLIVGDTQVFDEYGYESDVVYFWEEADSGDVTYSQTADEENYLFSVVYSSDDGFVLTMNDMEILSYLVIDDRACGISASGAKLNIVLNGTVMIGSDEERPYYGIFSEDAVSLASPGGNGAIFINTVAYGIQTYNDLNIKEGQISVDVDGYEDPDREAFGISCDGEIIIEGGEIRITKRGRKGDAVNSDGDIRIFGNADVSIVDWSTGHTKCGLHSGGAISIGANAQVDICSQSISIRASDSVYIGYEWDNIASEYTASGSPTVTVNDALSIAAVNTSNGGVEFIAGGSLRAQEVYLSGGRLKATGATLIVNNSITLPDGAYVYKSSTEADDPGGSWNYDNYNYSDEHNFIDIAFIHTITYHLNGGENHEDNADHYIFGESLTLEEPSKANHIFNGWYEQPDFSGSPVMAIGSTDVGDKTLYAKWTEQLPISTAPIEGVTAPVRGAVPVTAVAETAQYTGTVAWSPSDNPFVASTVYTATITLAPKDGYVLTGITPNFFTVAGAATVSNEADSGVITAVFPATAAAPSSSGGGSTTPTYKADVKAGDINKTTLPVTVNTARGTASVDTGSQELLSGGTTVMIPSVPHTLTYAVGIPVPNLSTADRQGRMTVETDKGNITVASNMLTGVEDINGSKAEISISSGGKDDLPEDVKSALGDRPIVRLSLSIDGQQTGWNNPDAPVTVSIPYSPSPEELEHLEKIVVWYIDGSGNPQCVTNGRYDPAIGAVTFDTTHFSDYAVTYNPVSFNDVAAVAWYNKAVSFIAARDITTGTGNGNYSPDAKLTRGDFLVLMMRAHDIAPDTNPQDNFADAGDTYYTGYLAAAKRLGISSGIGNNIGRVGEQHPEDATSLYAPEKEITRQEMFTLLYNALKATNQLPGTHGRATAAGSDQPGTHGRATAAGSDQPGTHGDSGKTLSDFTDAGQIDSWAKDAMTLFVETGTISGSKGALMPLAATTRAEMAQVLYNLLVK